MIELDLVRDEMFSRDSEDSIAYKQDFPNGFVCFHLSKTPTSKVFNRCYVELGCDKRPNDMWRMFDSNSFATAEAFERAKKWAVEVLTKYENILYPWL